MTEDKRTGSGIDKEAYRKSLLSGFADAHEILEEAGLAEEVLPTGVIAELENTGLVSKDEEYVGDSYVLPEKPRESHVKIRNKKLQKRIESRIGKTHAKNLFEQVADTDIEVLRGNIKDTPFIAVTPQRKQQEAENVEYLYAGGEITREHWIPYRGNNKFELEAGFVKWVDSWFPRGFSHAINYNKFNLYCQQADDWFNKGYDISNCFTEEEQVDFVKAEKNRFKENSLYYVYKHGRLKDGSFDGGRRRIEPYKAQKLLLYLLDCELSYAIGKMRQLGITSILGMGAACKTMYRQEWFTKYICENDEKTRDVFEDKIKYPISQTPIYLTPSSYSDQERQLKFGRKDVKGRTEGSNSKITVVPPSPTAVNSGSPQLVLIDEIGNIPVLTKMVNEARPTMFWLNPETGKIEMKRQLVMWGTGGEMKTDSFETEFRSAMTNWKNRNFEYGVIPVFLDAFCKPGVEGKFYESEKRNAYSKTGADREKTIAQFHAAYPVHIDDMFIRSIETLIPIATCNEHLKRIWSLPDNQRAVYGRFEPVFDYNAPTSDVGGNDWPYKIVGTFFVPMSEEEGERPVIMFSDVERNWRNRYFQGTDPINTESGHSRFASAIWDNEWKTVSCQVNFRVTNFIECYQQSLLMGLYYDPHSFHGVPELIEYNIGQDYISFRERKGFDKNLIYNKQLNPMMHVDGSRIGISNKAHTKGRIVGKMKELYMLHGESIYIEETFEQLKTFVQKSTTTGVKWQAEDLRKHYDDVLFSQTYAFMASKVYEEMGKFPIQEDEYRVSRKMKSRLERDAYGNLRRVIY